MIHFVDNKPVTTKANLGLRDVGGLDFRPSPNDLFNVVEFVNGVEGYIYETDRGSFYLKHKNIEIFEEDGQWKYKPIAEDEKEYKRDCFMGIMGFIPCFIKWAWFDRNNSIELYLSYYTEKFEEHKDFLLKDEDAWSKDWEQEEQDFLIYHIEKEKELADLTMSVLKAYFGDNCVLDFYKGTQKNIDKYFEQYIKFLESKIKGQPRQEQQKQIPSIFDDIRVSGVLSKAKERGYLDDKYKPTEKLLIPKRKVAFFLDGLHREIEFVEQEILDYWGVKCIAQVRHKYINKNNYVDDDIKLLFK